MSYISFHNHDTMSLLDSCLKTKDLVSWAKANNMDSVGITNHGEMGSLLSLYKECNNANVKPLLGIEFYVTEDKRTDDGKKIRDNWHLIVLCKNKQGWKNLIKLHNLSWNDEMYYYDPRITFKQLIQYKEGLIVTSACIGGVVGRPWLDNNIELAEKNIELLKNNFNDDFYLELQNHNDENEQEREKQHKYNKFLMTCSKKMNIKCIIQNDSHYYLKEDWEAHQVLLCKNTGSKLSNPKFKFGSKEYYLKNEVEMIETFNEYPLNFIEDCIKNTQEVADKVENFDIINKVYDCPSFGEPEETYAKLVQEIKIGLLKRFGKEFLDKNPNYLERIRYELGVIKQLKLTDYFLMLVDLVQFSEEHNIYMGIGRGSAVGSLVLYCLGVIHADPIRYNLLFERFLNIDRVSQADTDIDIGDTERQDVIDHIKYKFGENHVCNIGTYGELTAKASFKAVNSILEVPFSLANSISSLMDSSLTLEENYNQIPEFKKQVDNDDLLSKAYKIALKIEGTYAQRGLHACGMVISSKPLDDVCACVTVKDTKTGKRIVSTSNEMKEIDGDLKLLKMDYLSLRNLSIIKDTDKLIQEKYGTHPDYKNLNLEDKETYEMLSEGNTLGVFQFESNLMKNIIKQIKPKSIEDLSCVTSLARPGCTASGITQRFLDRKNGKEEVVSFADGTEDILKESMQLPIYQEQIMLLSRKMAGFTGSEADYLRKCITGDSIISLDNDFKSIEHLYKNKNKYIGSTIFSTNENFKTTKDIIVDIFDNGITDVYRIKTEKGYELKCTNTHKLMMLDKFRELKDIRIGDSIAINKKLKVSNHSINIKYKKLRLIAMIIGDGCISGKHAYFCNTDKNMVNKFISDFNEIYGECKTTVQKTSTGKDIYYIRFNKNKEAIQDIKRLISGSNSSDKKFGDYIYSLNQEQYINIIAGLIDTDGSINLKNCSIEYASKNKELIEQIVNILSKLGIYSKLYVHNTTYKNTQITNYRMFVCGEDCIKLRDILQNELYSYKNDIIKNIKLSNNYTTSKYNLPKEILSIIKNTKKEKQLSWSDIDSMTNSKKGTMSSSINFTKSNQGISKRRLQKFNIALNSKKIDGILNSDIVWDKIISIEYIGKEHVYDLQTAKEHNYIANSIVVHNCIGKKDPIKLKAERGHFVSGCIKNGYEEKRANEIFDGIEECGSYLFNKSHSIGYSLMSYATAYYKVHYPSEYMCAVLNSVTSDLDKLNLYIGECFRLGIPITPPDINVSNENFTLKEDGSILFGLNAIKGLGKSAISDIIKARKNGKFTSVIDFIERTTKVDKSNIQALLRVGAFNSIEQRPKQWDKLADYIGDAKNSKLYKDGTPLDKTVIAIVASKNAKKDSKYLELADKKRALTSKKSDAILKQQYTEEQTKVIDLYESKVRKYFSQYYGFSPKERISYEQELLGFNISINPYARWTKLKKYFINKNTTIPYVELNELVENGSQYLDLESIQTVAMISDIKEFKTKKGDKMAKLTIEYFGAKTYLTIFPKQWENNLEFKVQKGNLVLLICDIDYANSKYTDQEFEVRFKNIRQLNVLVNENIKCIIDLNNNSKEHVYSVIDSISSQELKDNMPIEKVIVYKIGDKYQVQNGLNWINDENKLLNML